MTLLSDSNGKGVGKTFFFVRGEQDFSPLRTAGSQNAGQRSSSERSDRVHSKKSPSFFFIGWFFIYVVK